MTDIFLSYNREDQARAKVFAEAFRALGFNVWWDVGLRTGEAYDEVTETALRTAKAVVVLWSKKSVVSRWVRAEATLAERNKTLVPCMIEPCDRPIMLSGTKSVWRRARRRSHGRRLSSAEMPLAIEVIHSTPTPLSRHVWRHEPV